MHKSDIYFFLNIKDITVFCCTAVVFDNTSISFSKSFLWSQGCWNLSQVLSGKGGIHFGQVASLLQGRTDSHSHNLEGIY